MSQHKQRTRLSVAALSALAIMASVAACSSGDEGASSDGSGGAAEKTTITYLSWENEELSRPIIDAFEAANPDITIDFSFSPPVTEYIQTLQTRIAGGQQPDVHRINPETKWTLIGEGLVRDLSDQPYIASLADANRQVYEVDGKIYGASFGAWAAGIYYNKDLLAEVGATEVPATWDEFVELCKKLDAAGITPYREQLQEMPRIFQGFLGAKYEAEDQPLGEYVIWEGDSTFAGEWTDAVTEWYRLYSEGIAGAESASLTGDQVRDDFIAGNTAMIATGPWDNTQIIESGLNFGIGYFPGALGNEQFSQGSPDPGFAISASIDGDKLAAAQKFVEFMASPEGLELMATQYGAMITADGYVSDVPEQYSDIYNEVLRNSRFYLCQDHWGEGAEALTVEAQAQFQQLAQGVITPEQLASAMDTKLASLK